MAIIIPSSKIYSIDDNKIIDNYINKIDMTLKDVSLVTKFGELVAKQDTALYSASTERSNKKWASVYAAPVNQYNVNFVAAVIKPNLAKKSVSIPEVLGDKLITDVNTGVVEGNEQIRYRVLGNIESGDASMQVTYQDTSSGVNVNMNTSSITESNPSLQENVYFTLQTNLSVSGQELSSVAAVSTTASIPTGELGSYRNSGVITYDSANGNFVGDVTAFCNGGYYSFSGGYVGNLNNDVSETVYGTYKKYIPTKIEFSFYGTLITLSLEDINYSDGRENADAPFLFDTNELMQDENKLQRKDVPIYVHTSTTGKLGIYTTTFSINYPLPYDIEIAFSSGLNPFRWATIPKGKTSTAELTARFVSVNNVYKPGGQLAYKNNELILDGYENGKETATIQCSVSNYYDENGNERLSINGDLPMTFLIGEEVIPMVLNSVGREVPMSLKKDGTSKKFRIVSNKVKYDGHITQELTLQEV